MCNHCVCRCCCLFYKAAKEVQQSEIQQLAWDHLASNLTSLVRQHNVFVQVCFCWLRRPNRLAGLWFLWQHIMPCQPLDLLSCPLTEPMHQCDELQHPQKHPASLKRSITMHRFWHSVQLIHAGFLVSSCVCCCIVFSLFILCGMLASAQVPIYPSGGTQAC